MRYEQKTDYSIYSLFLYFWSKKTWIAGTPLVFTVVIALWSLTITNTYLSDTVLSPTEESRGGGLANISGQLGGLASLAGLSMGENTTDNISIALAILESRKFIADFVNKYGIKQDIIAAIDWNMESGELIYDDELYDPIAKQWIRKPKNGRPSEPTDLEVYEVFRGFFTAERDSATGLITISIEFLSPVHAKEWLQLLILEVNEVMRKREIKTASENIAYLEQQVKNVAYIEMRTVFFQLIQEQSKNLMLAEVRNDFVFTVIDPPVKAELKYAPKRALICLFTAFITGFLMVLFFTMKFLLVPSEIPPGSEG